MGLRGVNFNNDSSSTDIDLKDVDSICDFILKDPIGLAKLVRKGLTVEDVWRDREDYKALLGGECLSGIFKEFITRGSDMSFCEKELYPYVCYEDVSICRRFLVEYLKVAEYPTYYVITKPVLRSLDNESILKMCVTTDDFQFAMMQIKRMLDYEQVGELLKKIYTLPKEDRGVFGENNPVDCLGALVAKENSKLLKTPIEVAVDYLLDIQEGNNKEEQEELQYRKIAMYDCFRRAYLMDETTITEECVSKLIRLGVFLIPIIIKRINAKGIEGYKRALVEGLPLAIDLKQNLWYLVCLANLTSIPELRDILSEKVKEYDGELPDIYGNTMPIELKYVEKDMNTIKFVLDCDSVVTDILQGDNEQEWICNLDWGERQDRKVADILGKPFRYLADKVLENIPKGDLKDVLEYSLVSRERKACEIVCLGNADIYLMQKLDREDFTNIIKDTGYLYSFDKVGLRALRSLDLYKREILWVCTEDFQEEFRKYCNYIENEKYPRADTDHTKAYLVGRPVNVQQGLLWVRQNREDIYLQLEEIRKQGMR